MSDSQATPEAKPEPEKPTDVLGEIDGVPFTRADAAKAKDARPVEASLEEWHAAFTKHREVEVTTPAYRSSTGLMFPAQTAMVKMPSIRNVVAHRVLHAMSPKDRAAVEKLASGDPVALLKLVAESELMTKGGKDHPAVPHWEPASQALIAAHAHPAALAKHHAELAKKSAAPSA